MERITLECQPDSQPSEAIMGKPKSGAARKPKSADKPIRHARLEFADEDYQRLKRIAKSNGLAVAAYIRQAVLQRMRRDESTETDG
jgi:hypothetical protein